MQNFIHNLEDFQASFKHLVCRPDNNEPFERILGQSTVFLEGGGKGGWYFGLVSAAVCGEPQMPSVDGRAGCRSSVQAGSRGIEVSHSSRSSAEPLLCKA